MIAFLIIVGMVLWPVVTVVGMAWVVVKAMSKDWPDRLQLVGIGLILAFASGACWWLVADVLGWWDTASAAAVFPGEVG